MTKYIKTPEEVKEDWHRRAVAALENVGKQLEILVEILRLETERPKEPSSWHQSREALAQQRGYKGG